MMTVMASFETALRSKGFWWVAVEELKLSHHGMDSIVNGTDSIVTGMVSGLWYLNLSSLTATQFKIIYGLLTKSYEELLSAIRDVCLRAPLTVSGPTPPHM